MWLTMASYRYARSGRILASMISAMPVSTRHAPALQRARITASLAQLLPLQGILD